MKIHLKSLRNILPLVGVNTPKITAPKHRVVIATQSHGYRHPITTRLQGNRYPIAPQSPPNRRKKERKKESLYARGCAHRPAYACVRDFQKPLRCFGETTSTTQHRSPSPMKMACRGRSDVGLVVVSEVVMVEVKLRLILKVLQRVFLLGQRVTLLPPLFFAKVNLLPFLQTHIFARMISNSSTVPLAFGSSALTMLLTSFVVPCSHEFEVNLELAITAHQVNGKTVYADGRVGSMILKIDNGASTLFEEKILRGITLERKNLVTAKTTLNLTEGDTIYLRLTNNTPIVVDANYRLNVRRNGYVTLQSANQLFTEKL